MAKQRIVNTRFWDDSYVAMLSPNEKLLFLYLLTSPLTTIAGIYELPIKRVAFDTGLAVAEIERTFVKFESDGKLLRESDWIGIVNFIRYQTLNPKVRQGIALELRRSPKSLVQRLPMEAQSLTIDFDKLSHSNSNPNSNLNPNGSEPPQGQAVRMPEELRREINELVERKRL